MINLKSAIIQTKNSHEQIPQKTYKRFEKFSWGIRLYRSILTGFSESLFYIINALKPVSEILENMFGEVTVDLPFSQSFFKDLGHKFTRQSYRSAFLKKYFIEELITGHLFF